MDENAKELFFTKAGKASMKHKWDNELTPNERFAFELLRDAEEERVTYNSEGHQVALR